jgi:hypothetical protein
MGSFGEHTVPNIKGVSLDRFLKEAQTGDIVLFSGKGTNSDIIRMVSHDAYLSHVGVVVRKLDTDKVYILESNNSTTPFDQYTQMYKDGVKLGDAKDKITTYVGYFIAWRRLIIPDELRLSREWNDKVMKVIEDMHDERYTRNISELVRSTMGGNYGPGTGYFCTKLVAHFYIHMGLMDSSVSDNNYALWQFTSANKLPLVSKDFRLRSERLIKTKTKHKHRRTR